MDGNRRLKKLFRSSKAGIIEPLPSPDTASTNSATTPTSTTHTITAANSSSFLPTAGSFTLANSTAATSTSSFGASPAPIHDMHKRRQQPPQQGITPFPMDAGRNDPKAITPFPMDVGRNDAGAPRRVVENRDPNWDVRNVTLAEMAQMEEEAASAAYRRDGSGFATPRSRAGTGSSIPPIDSTSWTASGAASGPSPVSNPPSFYLPPGAGPPSPQMAAIRPSTPPPTGRMMPPASNNGTQLPPPQAAFVEGESFPNARARGYSSASQTTRLSDHEGLPGTKLTKPMGPPSTIRSPLVNSYSEQHQPVSGQPQALAQYSSWQSTPMGSERSTPGENMERLDKTPPAVPEKSDHRPEKAEKEKKRFWNWGQPKHKDKEKDKDRHAKEASRDLQQRELAQSQRDAQIVREREAQLQQQAMPPPGVLQGQPLQQQSSQPQLVAPLVAQLTRVSIDESRPSHDERREPDPSNNGHNSSSIGHGDVRPGPPPDGRVNDVGLAIRKLASSRDTTHGAVIDLCEGVNVSHSGEAVGKEAARTIRKILKNGSDAERRMALRIWWITMRKITVRGFRHYASNRKFMAAVEPIVTQQLKPPPSESTLFACRDILSDLTFCHHKERGCEGLYELWKKVRLPTDPEYGQQLPDDYLKNGSRGSRSNPAPQSAGTPTPGLAPTPPPGARHSKLGLQTNHRPGSPGGFGPPYSSLPDHTDDVRRLIEECTAAKASARVLADALLYTRPEELEHKGVIKEFYMKSVLAHESLTQQMNWASSAAEKSRENVQLPEGQFTPEESALALLFEAHGALADSLKQYDDLEKMAMDERELKAVQERSKKDMRMDRRQQMDMLMAGDSGAQASSSRSPSPALRTAPLPDENQPAGSGGSAGRSDLRVFDRISSQEVPRNESFVNNHLSTVDDRGLSRTPSPDGARRAAGHTSSHSQSQPHTQAQAHAAQQQKKMASPTRTDSPLGRRIPGPRPLPNPFRSHNSSQNLTQVAAAAEPTVHGASHGSGDGTGDDGEEPRPSRKALGKRRADPDNDFDPDDMFKEKEKSDAASEHSVTADDVFFDKPVVYAYDAWAESEQARKEQARKEQAAMSNSGSAAKDATATAGDKHAAPNGARDPPPVNHKSSLRTASSGQPPAEVAAR